MSIIFDNIEIILNTEEKKSFLPICKDFSFKAEQGEIIGIIGPNGSGKTTLVNSIFNKNLIIKGEILIAHNTKISYIPQNYNDSFFYWTNLRNNILFFEKNIFRNYNLLKKRISFLKTEFKLDFSLSIKPGKCSGGMLQKTAILRAFFTNPNIILADEPFSSIDVDSVKLIAKSIRKTVKEQGQTILMVLHNIEDLLLVCDRIIYIPNKPFTTNENLKNHYLIKIFENKNINLNKNNDKDIIQDKLKFVFEN